MPVAIAALVAGSALIHPAAAQDNRTDRTGPDIAATRDRSGPTASQIAAEWDARTARIKADLRLTADQEKNWPKLESALRDIGQLRAQRQVAVRAEREKQNGAEDFIAHLNRTADALSERSADMKKLADAAQPLYASLDDHQKKHLAQALVHRGRDRDDRD